MSSRGSRVAYGTVGSVLGATILQRVLGRNSGLAQTLAAVKAEHQNQPYWTVMICNIALILLILCSRLFQKMFFGPMKLEEWTYLSSRLGYTMVEFTVAFVVVQEPITLKWLGLLAMFMSVKWFHWLSASRVEYSYSDVKYWRARLIVAFAMLHYIDIQWLRYYFNTIHEASMLTIILAFETAILYNSLIATSLHFLLNTLESTTGWTQKSTYLFVVRLLSDLIKLAMYIAFSGVLLAHYCIPLHMFKDGYLTLRISISKMRNLIQHKHLASLLKHEPDSIPHTTPRECIICRDVMDCTSQKLTQLPCNHVLHYHCLFEWLRQSPSCPICRAPAMQSQSRSVER